MPGGTQPGRLSQTTRYSKMWTCLEGAISWEYLNHVAILADDEELELQELQAGLNPLKCLDHFAANSIHGCSLYNGWFGT